MLRRQDLNRMNILTYSEMLSSVDLSYECTHIENLWKSRTMSYGRANAQRNVEKARLINR